jgi:ABC-type uncharacterized transport system involved in gliding motility auxiliary subunit
MRGWWKRLAIPCGIAGLAVLTLAVILYLLTRELDLRVEVLLGLGAVLLVASLAARPDALRSAITGRAARYGSNVGVSIVAFLGILALLNFLGDRHHGRLDLTEFQDYTLSPQTIQILSDLTEPVRVTAFFVQGDPAQQGLDDLLAEYMYHTDKITYEVVDPDVQPFVAQQYGITSYGTIVFESAGRRQDSLTVDEQGITGAILKVSRASQKVVYFLTGHGERDPGGYDQSDYSEIRDALERDNYVVNTLNLAISSTVPADASVLVVAAPGTPLLEQESEAISAYLQQGGKALIMQEPGREPALSEVLSEWGVEYDDDVVIDPERGLFGVDPLSPVVDSFPFSEITRDLPGVVLSTVRSITRTVEQPEGVTALALVESSAGSWGETDFEALGRQEARYDVGADSAGPLSMAMSVEAQGEGEATVGTRLVVFGDSDFAGNASLTLGGNGDLFLNSVNWLAEEEELISIRPKPPVSRVLILSPGQARFLQYSSVIFLPAAVLLVGAVVWWRRR